jgi:alcohol dehydrogenase class IV
MSVVTLLQPPRIVFGNGCAPNCVELLAHRGPRRVLVVTSTPVLPQLGFLFEVLKHAGCVIISSPPVDQEPTVAIFEGVLQKARDEAVEAVLGVGGGSALDVAKLTAALARSGQPVREVLGINRLQGRELFLVCLPTTSGTGSEVSPNAILLDETDQVKKGVVSPYLVPDAAVVDPFLTLSVPPPVTAATGLDALTHCIEAYANKFAHPAVDLYALEGIRLISANLLRWRWAAFTEAYAWGRSTPPRCTRWRIRWVASFMSPMASPTRCCSPRCCGLTCPTRWNATPKWRKPWGSRGTVRR